MTALHYAARHADTMSMQPMQHYRLAGWQPALATMLQHCAAAGITARQCCQQSAQCQVYVRLAALAKFLQLPICVMLMHQKLTSVCPLKVLEACLWLHLLARVVELNLLK